MILAYALPKTGHPNCRRPDKVIDAGQAEFCYRFNRRFELQDMLARFTYVALRTPPMPIKLLKMAEVHG